MSDLAALQPHNVSALRWLQPDGWTRSFELRSGETLIGRLEFQSAFGSLAMAEVGEEKWTMKRQGFFSPQVTLRRASFDEDLAVYVPKWTGSKGLLTFKDGTVLHLNSTSFWGGEWAWIDAEERTLVRFHNRGFLRHGADIDVEPGARSRTDLAVLLAMGWYLLYLYQQDTSAVVATT
ncbi:MAG: hypothetical protein IT161_17505 [Bryobacterales bacterium]|nr:hypothetical protein [Bryobacterales bacterium]